MYKDSLFNNFGFNIGFWIGIIFIVGMNYWGYLKGLEQFNSGFTPVTRVRWGFPIDWFGSTFAIPNPIYNGFAYIVICFGLGLITKVVLSKLSNSE